MQIIRNLKLAITVLKQQTPECLMNVMKKQKCTMVYCKCLGCKVQSCKIFVSFKQQQLQHKHQSANCNKISTVKIIVSFSNKMFILIMLNVRIKL